MKKFMKKLPVMITFLALTVVWLGVYLFMQLRPVAYGMTYKHKEYNKENKMTIETHYTLKCNNKAELVRVYYDDLKTIRQETKTIGWFVKEGKYIAFGEIAEKTNVNKGEFKTYEDFEKYAKENLLKESDLQTNYENGELYTMTGTAFTAQICHQEGEFDNVIQNCTNYETITFSVVGGIVILVLAAGAVWSTLLFVKDRKSKPAPVAETKAE